MEKSEVYFGGVPTGPEVKLIREKYPDADMKPGDFIPYESVEVVLKTDRKSYRFKTVTNRWRKLVEKDTGLVVGAKPNEGFVILQPGEVLDLGASKLRSGFRCVRRSVVVTGLIDRKKLTDEERGRCDILVARHAKILAAANVRDNGLKLPNLLESRKDTETN